jgi:hypothetical protein
MKIGYDFLVEMCSFGADFNAFTPKLNPITNRVAYITYQLEKMGVKYDLDMFNATNPKAVHIGKEKLVNINVFFKGASEDTIVFLAHHDVKNVKSENCQDNTASVCNLLHLCGILKNEVLDKNVLVVFTDAEEIAHPEQCGAKRLAILINSGKFGKVENAINLELTANGNNLWASAKKSKNLMKEVCENYQAKQVNTPYNDAFILEQNGISSVCIGTLTEREMKIALGKGFCSTWALCHKEEDKIGRASCRERV